MRIRTTRLVTLGLAGLGVAALVCGFAYITNSNTGLPLKWPPGTIPMRLMLDNVTPLSDGLTRAKSVQAAMVDPARGWNPNLGSAQFSPTIAAVGSGTDGNRINEVFFAASPYGGSWETNTLAVTTAWYSGNQRVEADIIFNNSYTWDSYRGPRQTAVDIQRVGLHELGHVLGLDHPDEAGQTEVAIMNSHVSNTDSLTADDIFGAQSLYGPPGIPANDNFAAAFAISGNPSAFVFYNTNTTKEPGEPNHAGNSGGRSVWFKWTAPSSGSVTVTTAGSVFDTTLGVYTGANVAALSSVANNPTLDDVQPGVVQSSLATFNAVGGTPYYIAVDGFNGSDGRGADSGAITLNITFVPFGVTTTTSTSTVASSSISTTTTSTIPPTSGGGGGGGGAYGGWFSGVLALLCLLRWRLKKN